MAEPRAVIDVVGAKPGADQLLEKVGLLVRAFCRAVARERVPVFVADAFQAIGGQLERLVPTRLAKYFRPVAGIDGEIRRLLHARLADQRLGEAVRMVRVVEAVASLDA